MERKTKSVVSEYIRSLGTKFGANNNIHINNNSSINNKNIQQQQTTTTQEIAKITNTNYI